MGAAVSVADGPVTKDKAKELAGEKWMGLGGTPRFEELSTAEGGEGTLSPEQVIRVMNAGTFVTEPPANPKIQAKVNTYNVPQPILKR